MDTIRLDEYNKIETALNSRLSYLRVSDLLTDDFNSDLHAYFCEELSKSPAVCSRCEMLLKVPLQTMNTMIIHLLLQHGVYPSEDICTAGYQYNHTRYNLLERATKAGSLDDVKQLLSEGKDDVNAHPRFCASRKSGFPSVCGDCDTPLMAAVRREDIAMIRLLIAHGANVLEDVHGDFGCRPCGSPCLRKTALLVALHTKNKEVITELVTSGADVNQSLGPVGTALHYFYDHVEIVELLVQLGADLNATSKRCKTTLSIILYRCHFTASGIGLPAPALLHSLLPATHDLDAVLLANFSVKGVMVPIKNDCMTTFLQHGAKINYCAMYLAELQIWRSLLQHHGKHSERFIELLRAADTDFSGVRQRIASVDKEDCKRLNLAVLDQKLSQPLTLQASCVISVRRQLRSVKDCGLWAMIEKLPLPTAMKDRLKLKSW